MEDLRKLAAECRQAAGPDHRGHAPDNASLLLRCAKVLDELEEIREDSIHRGEDE